MLRLGKRLVLLAFIASLCQDASSQTILRTRISGAGTTEAAVDVEARLTLQVLSDQGQVSSFCPADTPSCFLTKMTPSYNAPNGITVQCQADLCFQGEIRYSYKTTIAGGYRLSVIWRGQHLEGSPFTPRVTPSVARYASYFLDTVEFVKSVTVHQPDQNVFFVAGDKFQNPVTDCTATISITMEASTPFLKPLPLACLATNDTFCLDVENIPRELTDIPNVVGPCAAGVYRITFQPSLPGTYRVRAKVNGLTTDTAFFPFTATAAQVVAATTFAYGARLSGGIAMVVNTFTVQARDAHHNDHRQGGAKFNVTTIGPPYNKLLQGNMTDLGDGTYQCSYYILMHGVHQLSITFDKRPIIGVPFTLNVTEVTRTLDPGTKFKGFIGNLSTFIAGQRAFFIYRMNIPACPKFPEFFPRIELAPNNNPSQVILAVNGGCYFQDYVLSYNVTRSGMYTLSVKGLNAYGVKDAQLLPSMQVYVSPDVAVMELYGVAGDALYKGMANVRATFELQSRDVFGNGIDACSDVINVTVVHEAESTLPDTLALGTVVAKTLADGTTIENQVGIIPQYIRPFTAELLSCVGGAYKMLLPITLSGTYDVHVMINSSIVKGSPFKVPYFAETEAAVVGKVMKGISPYSRWKYFTIEFDRDGVGFQAVTTRTSGRGQPWTFIEYRQATLQPMLDPVELRGRVVHKDTDCSACRVHVPPNLGLKGKWFVGVYGYSDDVTYDVVIHVYEDKKLPSTDGRTGIQVTKPVPGVYYYYRFSITSVTGFQARVLVTGGRGGYLQAVLKKGGYPQSARDATVNGVHALWAPNCTKCLIPHKAGPEGVGDWYLLVSTFVKTLDFDVRVIAYDLVTIPFGASQSTRHATVLPGAWLFYVFHVDPESDPAGFQVQVVPEEIYSDINTAVKVNEFPEHGGDNSFGIATCVHCRHTVVTRLKMQKSWYIGVYGNTVGGNVTIKAMQLESCPRACSGNGYCRIMKIPACVCYPGYTGIDCSEAVKDKVYAWFPLDKSTEDYTGNQVPLYIKVNYLGDARFADSAFFMRDAYLTFPPPTASNFTTGGYQPPRTAKEQQFLQAEYDPYKELTVMYRFRMIAAPLPGEGSGMGLGRRVETQGSLDVDKKGMWSWIIYPRVHSNNRHVVFDVLFRNETHEFSLQEGVVYPITGENLIEKLPQTERKFPDFEPIVRTETWYHVCMVFSPTSISLWFDGKKVASAVNSNKWQIPRIENGRFHIGHDPRFFFFERLFFGHIQDVRVLRYSASPEEIRDVAINGHNFFKYRSAEASGLKFKEKGTASNPMVVSTLDDGSLDPDVAPHEAVCRDVRNPNEDAGDVTASACPFQGTAPMWVYRNSYQHSYRGSDADSNQFGLGYMLRVLKDRRPEFVTQEGRFKEYGMKQ